MTVLLWHIDEHVIELLERVIVSIAAEDVRHFTLSLLFIGREWDSRPGTTLLPHFFPSLICTNVHTLQTRAIIDEQIGQLGRKRIICHLVDHANIVVGEEVNSTILSHYTDNIKRQ